MAGIGTKAGAIPSQAQYKEKKSKLLIYIY